MIKAHTLMQNGLICAALLPWATGFAAQPAKQIPAPGGKPNVVIVLVDDSGFSDLSCYGSEIPTPNLDKLAAGGMRFTQFTNASQCMPTRTALMAGNYHHLVGCPIMEGPGAKYDEKTGQRLSQEPPHGTILRETPTIAEVLRHNGYQTFHTGKWHCGKSDESQWPLQRGFDRFYGTLVGSTSQKFNSTDIYEGNTPVKPPFPEGWFIGNAITDKALEYLRGRDPSKPFFLYHCPLEPHWPFVAPAEDIKPFIGKYEAGYDVLRQQRLERMIQLGLFPAGTKMEPRDPSYQPWEEFKAASPDWHMKNVMKIAEAYAGSIKNIDDNVGRLVAELERQGVLDNTIFMFLSDNGSEKTMTSNESMITTPFNTVHNAPFRKHKTSQHYGGVATPFIVHWPAGGVPAGTINKVQAGHVKDIMGTLIEATGSEFPKENLRLPTQPHGSDSLLAAWRDPSHSEPRTYFYERLGNQAVRSGNWKLVMSYHPLDNIPGATVQKNRSFPTIPKHIKVETWRPPNARPRIGQWELYDIATDPTEMNNLAGKHPEKVAELSKLFDEYWAKTRWPKHEQLFDTPKNIAEWDAKEAAGETK